MLVKDDAGFKNERYDTHHLPVATGQTRTVRSVNAAVTPSIKAADVIQPLEDYIKAFAQS